MPRKMYYIIAYPTINVKFYNHERLKWPIFSKIVLDKGCFFLYNRSEA